MAKSKERQKIDRDAGLSPKRGERYTSPGGFVKVPAPSGGPVRHTPPEPKKKKS